MAKIDSERLGVYLKTALQVLNENGGQLPSREVIRKTEEKLELTEYEKATFEKSGYVRWESTLHFWSIACVKAGWLLKKKGIWYITPEGIESLKFSPKDFINVAHQKYEAWYKTRGEIVEPPEPEAGEIEPAVPAYEQALGNAREEIRNYINNLDPYEFQGLVAALLRAMGYNTPFVAPKGKDGGIDILAYRDPFGIQPPRVKVQVKHREQKAIIQEINQLKGVLHKEGDTGLFVSSGGFTPDALNAIRNASPHIEKLDLDTFVNLWEEYYERMTEEDKALMPLRKISFLAPNE